MRDTLGKLLRLHRREEEERSRQVTAWEALADPPQKQAHRRRLHPHALEDFTELRGPVLWDDAAILGALPGSTAGR